MAFSFPANDNGSDKEVTFLPIKRDEAASNGKLLKGEELIVIKKHLTMYACLSSSLVS